MTEWSLYVPIKAEAPPVVKSILSWCPQIDIVVPDTNKLLCFVSSAEAIAAIRDMREETPFHVSIVMWAWLLQENRALHAETDFPVVYGLVSESDLDKALEQGPVLSKTTSLIAKCEDAFGMQLK